jgi:hypothetical protein
LEFHTKLCTLRFFDPACGCGNFLVVAYRELRRLELVILKQLYGKQAAFNVEMLVRVNVNQFYGLEIEEFPADIARTALWLTDHQMNMEVSGLVGSPYIRIPFTASPTIRQADALTTDWKELLDPAQCSYILGNPPFIGARWMNPEQKAELNSVFGEIKGVGNLDYVSCWYKKAADYMQGTGLDAAFVSTNSITQGEQAVILFQSLFSQGIHINFAHQTFKWGNDAAHGQGQAAVHCVIVGFSYRERPNKRLFTYAKVTGEPAESAVKRINAYLYDAPQVFIESRNKPLCDVPEIGIGNKPIDGGNYLFTTDEKEAFITKEPQSAKRFRKWLGSDEFINGWCRWCLWLGDCPPEELRKMPEAMKRVEAVKAYRLASKSAPTRAIAAKPRRFHVENMPKTNYIVIPEVSSERRRYIPIGFLTPDVICSNKLKLIPNATVYHFGVLQSTMHMAWMRTVCCRLKSDYSYSNDIVYNNFPWPAPTDKQKSAIEKAAQAVLDARALYPKSSLADLYDPVATPPELVDAHKKLDKAVDSAYNREFDNDEQRVAWLFDLYQHLTGQLFTQTKKQGKGRKLKGA